MNQPIETDTGAPLRNVPARLVWDDGDPSAEPRVLASGTTDDAGFITLSWKPSVEDVKKAAANDGWFNFGLLVGEQDAAGLIYFPRKWAGGRGTLTQRRSAKLLASRLPRCVVPS